MNFIELNPYRDISPSDILRISNDVSRTHAFRIRSVAMDYGFLNTSICLFVKHLHNYVDEHCLIIDDRDRLIKHILKLVGDGINPDVFPTGPAQGGPRGPGPHSDGRPDSTQVDSSGARAPHVKRTRSRKPAGAKDKQSGSRGISEGTD